MAGRKDSRGRVLQKVNSKEVMEDTNMPILM